MWFPLWGSRLCWLEKSLYNRSCITIAAGLASLAIITLSFPSLPFPSELIRLSKARNSCSYGRLSVSIPTEIKALSHYFWQTSIELLLCSRLWEFTGDYKTQSLPSKILLSSGGTPTRRQLVTILGDRNYDRVTTRMRWGFLEVTTWLSLEAWKGVGQK